MAARTWFGCVNISECAEWVGCESSSKAYVGLFTWTVRGEKMRIGVKCDVHEKKLIFRTD